MFSKRNHVTIRKMEAADLDAVIALNLSEWGADYFGTDEEAERLTREQYNDTLRHTLVAVSNGQVIGTAGLVEHDVYNVYEGQNIRDINLGYCSRLVVHKDHRKQGVAKALLISREKLATEHGFTDLFLIITHTRDSDLCRMHLDNGWRIAKEKPMHGFGNCLILTKELLALSPTLSRK